MVNIENKVLLNSFYCFLRGSLGKINKQNALFLIMEEEKTNFVMHNGVNLIDLIDQPAWKTVLLSLVNSEKMDIWNLDIDMLADAYLSKINTLSTKNLRVPANAILASAILLRFKSRIVKISSIEDELDEDVIQDSVDLDNTEKQIFEEILPQLKNIRRIKEGHISLDSLVDAIEVILEKSKKKRSKIFEREAVEFRVPLSDFNIEERMNEVYDSIQKNVDSQGMLVFSSLLKENDPVAVVRTFIPCLFLFNKGNINMWQDEFWEDIFISVNKQ